MVYIPWEEKGVCKFHMLGRCSNGEKCKHRHPSPERCQWLWDYETKKQKEEEKRGIPPPSKPAPRAKRDYWATGSNKRRSRSPGRDEGHARNGTDSNIGERGRKRARSPTGYLQSVIAPPASPPPSGLGDARQVLQEWVDEELLAHKARLGGEDVLPSIPEEQPGHQGAEEIAESEHDVAMDDVPSPWEEGRFMGSSCHKTAEEESVEAIAVSAKVSGGDKDEQKNADEMPTLSRPSAAAVTVWRRSENDAKTLAMLEGRNYWETSTIEEKLQAAEDLFRNTSPEASEVGARNKFGQGRPHSDGSASMSLLLSSPSTQPPPNRALPLTPAERTSFLVPPPPPTGSLPGWSHQHPLLPGVPLYIPPQKPTSRLPKSDTMVTSDRQSDGANRPIGPHPGTVRVSAPYISQTRLEKSLQSSSSQPQLDPHERSIAEAREDTVRLQGVTWIDNVRRALQLPIRTYTTACVYYHKFRLTHASNLNGMEYGNAWADTCAACLLVACKVEDTLKKSRDILAAAYNLKTTAHDQVGADDAMFDAASRAVIGLERLALEAGRFDFRHKYPHRMLVKVIKSLPEGEEGERGRVTDIAWTVTTDLYRTFAPLKQTTMTMALACLELAAHLDAAQTPNNTSAIRDGLQQVDLQKHATNREEVMETLLDLLDLYTQHTSHSILGTKYSLDDFLRIRLAFNKECSESNIPRYTIATRSTASATEAVSTLRVSNGHPTPVSPMESGAHAQTQTQAGNTAGMPSTPEGGSTLRFMLDPERAAHENSQVQRYFNDEMEEYEEDVEVPLHPNPLQAQSASHESSTNTAAAGAGRNTPTRSDGDRARRPGHERERDFIRERDREAERERTRAREVDRDRRFGGGGGERRFDERERRFEERRDRRYDDRRFEDDRRRREERR